MGFTAFSGLFLLGVGPLIVLFLSYIAWKSFLVLLALGSAFYWLVTLFIISSLFRGFEPLQSSASSYLALVLVATLLQEAARYGLWILHKAVVKVLEQVAHEHGRPPLNAVDHISLALTYGFAHGLVHSLFMFVSWLPLCLGDATIYVSSCPQLSFFVVGAISTLAFAVLLTAGMVIAFELAASSKKGRAIIPSILHIIAALITLGNFAQGGCLITCPLLLALAGGTASWAAIIWWQNSGRELQQNRMISLERRQN